MDVSFQLYSARNFTPWPTVIRTLAEHGYTQVEGFAPVYEDAAAFRAVLDQAGITMPSGHFSLEALETDLPGVLATARTLGIARVFCPYLLPEQRPADSAGWVEIARRLAAIDQQVREAGLAFGWHNHDFELTPLPDGAVPMQILLEEAPTMDWEADLAWITRGDADPFTWIARYGDRITAAHVKDLAPAGEKAEEDGWADVGEGTMPWPDLLRAVRDAGCSLLVVEHDNPSELDRFAGRSITNLRSF